MEVQLVNLVGKVWEDRARSEAGSVVSGPGKAEELTYHKHTIDGAKVPTSTA